MNDAIWITWERQPRNLSASKYLGATLFEILYPKHSRIRRYVKSILTTVKLIYRERPKYVFAQNPSIILCVLATLLSTVFGYKLVVDAHNTGVEAEGRFSSIINSLNKFVMRHASAVIITNSDIARIVSSCGGNPIIMPDPLPTFTNYQSQTEQLTEDLANRKMAFCITSWGLDEPVKELIQAAGSFQNTIEFYFSGNYKKAPKELIKDLPSNVNLLGFVDETTYQKYLFRSDFTIDLTIRDGCLVCGAYESVSACKPVLLSDTAAQRNFFSKGAVFCSTTISGIEKGILDLTTNLSSLQVDVKKFREQAIENEARNKHKIIEHISNM